MLKGLLLNRYTRLFGLEPTEDTELGLIEKELRVKLPYDFTALSKFYSGGILGGISHHAIASRGSATNITDETKRLRDVVGLPHPFVALAEPPVSLIVMDTAKANSSTAVIWCDANDVCRLGDLQGMHNPQTWPSYAEFFRLLLDREEQERAEVN